MIALLWWSILTWSRPTLDRKRGQKQLLGRGLYDCAIFLKGCSLFFPLLFSLLLFLWLLWSCHMVPFATPYASFRVLWGEWGFTGVYSNGAGVKLVNAFECIDSFVFILHRLNYTHIHIHLFLGVGSVEWNIQTRIPITYYLAGGRKRTEGLPFSICTYIGLYILRAVLS